MTVSSTKYQNKEPICDEKGQRTFPIIHPTSDAPLCSSCEQLELPFFDPSCPGCMEILKNQNTSVSQIFAIIRQWMPQTQQNIQLLVNEILKRGAHVDDRDGLTDMTILQYACKAGAIGVGDAYAATETVKMLLESGADTQLKCRWTDMTALHYAVYFDVVPVLEILFEIDKNIDVNIPCQEFDGGSALHIASFNLCAEAAKILIKHGGDVNLKDYFKRTPYDCIPQISEIESMSDVVDIICNLRKLLESKSQYCEYDLADYSNVTGRTVLKSLRLKLGDKVIVGGAKVGVLRYCGTTKFAPGIWAGVELDEPLGKNNGTIDGVTYFRCSPYHGIFAPTSKICKCNSLTKSSLKVNAIHQSLLPRHINHPRIDISRITSKIETGLSALKSHSESIIGDKVFVSGRSGTVKFIGETKFASGVWYGIELDKAEGKNDGCIQGIRYFTCKPNHGLFVSYSKITKFCTSRNSDSISDNNSSLNLTTSNSRSSTDGENEMLSLESQHKKSTKQKRFNANSTNINDDCWLAIGTNIFVKNEIATVRYIGYVDFANGIWLGIELRKPKGKNDGSVQGRRYFTCKPSHGLMVRPNRVTVRGISGSKLLGNFNKLSTK